MLATSQITFFHEKPTLVSILTGMGLDEVSEEDVCKGARFDFTTQKYLDIQIELLREALAGPTIPDDVEVSVLDEHDVIEVLNSSELKPSVPGTLCNRRHSNDNLFPPAAENELPLEPIDEGEEPSDGHTY